MSWCCCFDDCGVCWSKLCQSCGNCPPCRDCLRRRKLSTSSRHPHIQYSPVSSFEDHTTSKGQRRTFGGRDVPFSGSFSNGVSRGKIPPYHYAFTQGKRELHIHPQLSIGEGDLYGTEGETITEQPSSRTFFQTFELIRSETPVTSETVGDEIPMPGLPVYRERAIKGTTNGGAGVDGKKTPIVQFSLHYDIQKSKLSVSLHHAVDLPVVYFTGTSTSSSVRCDPFVMLHLEPDRRQTHQSRKIKETLNPVFDENFVFEALPLGFIKLQTLVLRMYNGAQGNKVIGKACLPLSDAELFGAIVQMKLCRDRDQKEMEENYQGDLHISLSYSPVSCKLEGIIHKATGLRKHDFFGKADPYVKVIIKYKDKQVFKWRSAVKHNTLTPVYNESFTYHVTEEMRMAIDVADVVLYFYLIDYDYLMPNDKMGIFSVGRDVPSKLGRKHWNEVLRCHGQRISFWHPIQLATPAQIRSRCSSPIPQ